jgi:hypothetical protein
MLLTNFIIQFTSSIGLFIKLSVESAQRVRYSIHLFLANFVTLTTLSAHALCHNNHGKKLSLAHLRFQSIIIQRCFIIIL